MSDVTRKDKQQEVNIHYEVIGQGEPIVFHHGNGNCIKDWHTLGYVNNLSKDFQLILIDSRGYGKSSKFHDPADYNLQSRAQDTISVLDELKINKAHCLGGSIGAAMCMILAKYFPERFKSYIFATPYFTLFDENIREALLKGPDAYVAKLEELLESKISNDLIRQTFFANDTKAVWAANGSEWFNYLDYVQYIKTPSLIYAGSKEPSVESLTILSKSLPNNILSIIANIDHVQAYWNSNLVSPLIREFVRSV
jgi:pimeloyl-ACP methyl ester carboxylesterase